MLNVVDKRDHNKKTHRFCELDIGDCYLDDNGNVCIKTSNSTCIYFDENGGWDKCSENTDEPIVLLSATLTIDWE